MLCRYTLSNIKAAVVGGKAKVAEATSRELLTEPQCFDLFSVNPQVKARAYRYAWGTSHKVNQQGTVDMVSVL